MKPCLKIIDEIHSNGIQGEEDSILVLIIKAMLRLVNGCSLTSSNTVVSDESGSRKDAITKAVTTLLIPQEDYFYRKRISAKALEYWGTNKPKGWIGEHKVLILEDPEEEALQSQTFRVLSSGENCTTTVKDRKLIDVIVPGKPVILITSLNATTDEEGTRRGDCLRVDTTEALTRKVICEKLKRQESIDTQPNDSRVQHALHHLFRPYSVVISFASQLASHLPNTLIMLAQVDKLIDYTKASAVLHQREKKDGKLIATWFDYEYAPFVFQKLRDDEGRTLNKAEEEFLEVLRTAEEPLSVREISMQLKRRSTKWIYDNVDAFKRKGLIEESNE